MNLEPLAQSLMSALGQKMPTICGALAIFVIGWLLALILRSIVRGVLGRLGVNRRMHSRSGTPTDVESFVTGAVFWRSCQRH